MNQEFLLSSGTSMLFLRDIEEEEEEDDDEILLMKFD